MLYKGQLKGRCFKEERVDNARMGTRCVTVWNFAPGEHNIESFRFYLFQKNAARLLKNNFQKMNLNVLSRNSLPCDARMTRTNQSCACMTNHVQVCSLTCFHVRNPEVQRTFCNFETQFGQTWSFLGAFCLNQSFCNIAMKTENRDVTAFDITLISGSNASQWAVAPQNFQCRSMADSSACQNRIRLGQKSADFARPKSLDVEGSQRRTM